MTDAEFQLCEDHSSTYLKAFRSQQFHASPPSHEHARRIDHTHRVYSLQYNTACKILPMLATQIYYSRFQVACLITEKGKHQTDQSNSPYSVMFRYSLHLIGPFGNSIFPWWDKKNSILQGWSHSLLKHLGETSPNRLGQWRCQEYRLCKYAPWLEQPLKNNPHRKLTYTKMHVTYSLVPSLSCNR